MGKDYVVVHDVEEGEISDSDSIEEISEADFKNPDARVLRTNGASSALASENSGSRVWSMCDVYRYPISSGYASGLYNLAWAQAVQNKSLNEVLLKVEQDGDSKGHSTSSSNTTQKDSTENKETSAALSRAAAGAIINGHIDEVDARMDGPKEVEEGELEEGEIDLDELVDKPPNAIVEVLSNNLEVCSDPDVDLSKREVKQVNLILEALKTMSVLDAQKFFIEACLRLQSILKTLHELLLKTALSPKDISLQLSFSAVQAVNYVFSSMDQNQKEQNKDVLSRLLSWVMSQASPPFIPDQMKEIEAMSSSVKNSAASAGAAASDKEIEGHVSDCVDQSRSDLLAKTKSVELLYKNGTGNLSDVSIPAVSSLKGRPVFGSLLDLHKDHDVESLPSPTRETLPCFSMGNESATGDGVNKSDLSTSSPTCKAQDPSSHCYETDALVTVSTYQQKFGWNSFHSSTRLPSPTPSEGGDDGDGDTSDEVSSRISAIDNMKFFAPSVMPSIPRTIAFSAQGMSSIENKGPVSSGCNAAIGASAKSRDPRLLIASSSAGFLDHNDQALPMVSDVSKVEPGGIILSSRKQKTSEEPVSDGPAMKRLKVSTTCGKEWDGRAAKTHGWLENPYTLGPQFTNKSQLDGSGMHAMNLKNGLTSTHASSGKHTAKADNEHFTELLNNIAMNPSVLLNLLKIAEKQRLFTDSQQKSAEPEESAGHPSITNSMHGFGQKSPGKNLSEEIGKVRMKPRDPRRILHLNTSQNTGMVQSEQLKPNEADAISMLSLSAAQPNVSQQASTDSLIPQAFPHSIQTSLDRADSKSFNGKPVVSASETIQSCNRWADVEHLFEGYDTQQKAVILRERARRIDEQKKMFAARKLCLVLDLDHTLINSAKFGEIDPVHEEMLRKKEEQDREKPERQLFRFSHMGMWTKLRPGLWNFLERASKIFELHLYTMGNKLYATEMVKIIDPKGALFGGRVIARGDDGDLFDGEERIPKVKDLDGVLGMESSIVIVDDSVRVWPHNRLNLIVVERYTYFPCSRRQFGLPGPSLLEIDHDERQEDGTLASSLAVIERLHQIFFANPLLDEMDVRNILASEQRKILGGCRVVFSRVFPVGEANPQLHPLWQTAEQFGAECTIQIDERVTHVVANSLGTDKVNWALSTGRYVVHPGWVEASALLYRRANEQDFTVKQ